MKRFTVQVPGGLHGFSPGKEVRLVKEDGGFLVVTDGVVDGRAPKDHFTNNLDIADEATREMSPPPGLSGDSSQTAVSKTDHRNEELRQKSLELARTEERLSLVKIDLENEQESYVTLEKRIQNQGRYDGIIDLRDTLYNKVGKRIGQLKEQEKALETNVARLKATIARLQSEISLKP